MLWIYFFVLLQPSQPATDKWAIQAVCDNATCSTSLTPTLTSIVTHTATYTPSPMEMCAPAVTIRTPMVSMDPTEEIWLVSNAISSCTGSTSFSWACSVGSPARRCELPEHDTQSSLLRIPKNSLEVGTEYKFTVTATLSLLSTATTVSSMTSNAFTPTPPTLVAVIDGGSRIVNEDPIALSALQSFSGKQVLGQLSKEQLQEYSFQWTICQLPLLTCNPDILPPVFTTIPRARTSSIQLSGSTAELEGSSWGITLTVSHSRSSRQSNTGIEISYRSGYNLLLYIVHVNPPSSYTRIQPTTAPLTLTAATDSPDVDAVEFQWEADNIDLVLAGSTSGGNDKVQVTIPPDALQRFSVDPTGAQLKRLAISVSVKDRRRPTVGQTATIVILIEGVPVPCIECDVLPFTVYPTTDITPGATFMTLTSNVMGWRFNSVVGLAYRMFYKRREYEDVLVPVSNWTRLNVSSREIFRAPVFGFPKSYSIQFVMYIRTPLGTLGKVTTQWLSMVQFVMDETALVEYVQNAITTYSPTVSPVFCGSHILKYINTATGDTLISYTFIITNRLINSTLSTHATLFDVDVGNDDIQPAGPQTTQVVDLQALVVFVHSIHVLLQSTTYQFTVKDIQEIQSTLTRVSELLIAYHTANRRLILYFTNELSLLFNLLISTLSSLLVVLQRPQLLTLEQQIQLQSACNDIGRSVGQGVVSSMSVGQGVIMNGHRCSNPLIQLGNASALDVWGLPREELMSCGVAVRVFRDQLSATRTLDLFTRKDHYGGPPLIRLGTSVTSADVGPLTAPFIAIDVVLVYYSNSPLSWLSRLCLSDWFNADTPLDDTVDDEGLHKHLGNSTFMAQCSSPVHAQCQTVDGVQWDMTGEVASQGCSVNGIVCRGVDNDETGCADYMVRYFCPCNDLIAARPVSSAAVGSTNGVYMFAVSNNLQQKPLTFDSRQKFSEPVAFAMLIPPLVGPPAVPSPSQRVSVVPNHVCARYSPDLYQWTTEGVSTRALPFLNNNSSILTTVVNTIVECTTDHLSNFALIESLTTPVINLPPGNPSTVPTFPPNGFGPTVSANVDDDEHEYWWISVVVASVLLILLLLLMWWCLGCRNRLNSAGQKLITSQVGHGPIQPVSNAAKLHQTGGTVTGLPTTTTVGSSTNSESASKYKVKHLCSLPDDDVTGLADCTVCAHCGTHLAAPYGEQYAESDGSYSQNDFYDFSTNYSVSPPPEPIDMGTRWYGSPRSPASTYLGMSPMHNNDTSETEWLNSSPEHPYNTYGLSSETSPFSSLHEGPVYRGPEPTMNNYQAEFKFEDDNAWPYTTFQPSPGASRTKRVVTPPC